MVVQGAFRVELVEASTKNPFPEHSKDGNTYVEVEPDVEYFVSIQKIGTMPEKYVSAELFVDRISLGFQQIFVGSAIDRQPSFKGLYRVENGTASYQALKFVKPSRMILQTEGGVPEPSMGTVEIKIYEAAFKQVLRQENKTEVDRSKDFRGAAVAHVPQGGAKKKCLRSGLGGILLASKHSPKVAKPTSKHAKKSLSRDYVRTRLLEPITLNYCAVPGLILAGIFNP